MHKEISVIQPEVVTFGESMGLMSAHDSRGLEYASTLHKSFGGAESNVAIGIARLGHRSGWCGSLGQDPLGTQIYKAIRGEGVDVSRALLSSEAPTGLMIRENAYGKSSVYYYRKGSAASQMRPDQLDASYIQSARILHVTGITAAISPLGLACVETAMDIARSAGVKVCFDPNLRLKLWTLEEASPVLLRLAQKCDYFLPGMDELRLLYGTEDETFIWNELSKLDAVSIVKGGPDLTYVLEHGTLTEIPYYKAEQVIDTVGAGDGFCAGFITGLLKNYSPVEAVRLGSVTGSMVVQAAGDWEALPTSAQVEALLNHKAHIER
ncbi:sugar kinase [Paenibacillus pini]|uniref:2-dehydro-3-deoxygluconate kinase n=1 Tax=Paenibacillus pini JCM 16418 TaxID=1236976 RepID=W7YEE2_9BACL|nr:sugar kinase [Paenibacillus pini]GAF06857.1 2-dehydro-3-deoxygluconate kinase [Paenibacillus pini JCM 16418]